MEEFRTSHDEGWECSCVKYHRPKPTHLEFHHILPLKWGGDNSPSNKAPLCGTAHNGVHMLLDAYLRYDGAVPWEIRKHFNPYIRALAEDGWKRWTTQPPARYDWYGAEDDL